MSLFTAIKEKLVLWHELCERRKTAAEKVIQADIVGLHDGLVALEAKVVVIEREEARKFLGLLVAAGHKAETLEAAIAAADTQQKAIDDNAKAALAQAEAAKANAAAPGAAPAVAVPTVEAAPAPAAAPTAEETAAPAPTA